MLNFLQASDNPIHAYFFSQAKNLGNQRENGAWKPNLISAGDFWSAGSPSAHALWRRCFGVHFESVILSAFTRVNPEGSTRHELFIIVEL